MLDDLLYRLPDSAFVTLWIASVGLVIGSYLNVVVYRVPAGISTVRPGSRCPRCLSPIGAVDNIPVLSYVLLCGKCRSCGGRISLRYPAVEAMTALLFVSCYRLYPDRPFAVLVGVFLCCVWLVSGLIDWDRRLVPLSLIVPALVLVLAAQPFLGWVPVKDAWLGALASTASMAVFSGLWRRRTGDLGFGAGDLWGIALAGATWGWQGAVAVFAGAAALGLLFAVGSKINGDRRDSVPLVTLMAVSSLGIYILWPSWS